MLTSVMHLCTAANGIYLLRLSLEQLLVAGTGGEVNMDDF